MASSALCPCGSGRAYAACCEPFHAGGEPPDAEALMRSRYAAFARGELSYLFRTLHADHDDHAQGEAAWVRSAAQGAKRARYDALAILDRDGPDTDGVARVLFHVTMRVDGRDASFAELSSFAHDGTGWRYVGGVTRRMSYDRAAPLRIATFERETS
ncbi:MAG: YchJ family metal-binding protein [Sandaracinus sp.]